MIRFSESVDGGRYFSLRCVTLCCVFPPLAAVSVYKLETKESINHWMQPSGRSEDESCSCGWCERYVIIFFFFGFLFFFVAPEAEAQVSSGTTLPYIKTLRGPV